MLDGFFDVQKKRFDLVLGSVKKGKILDLGSYQGVSSGPSLHEYLKENLKDNVIGVDVQKSKNVDVVWDLNKNLTCFPKESFDTIVLGEIIEHVLEPYRLLKDCFRLLKKGGRIIITTPNMTAVSNIVKEDKDSREYGHKFSWNVAYLTNLIKEARFEVVESKYIDAFYSKNLLFRFIGFAVPRFKSSIFIVAEK